MWHLCNLSQYSLVCALLDWLIVGLVAGLFSPLHLENKQQTTTAGAEWGIQGNYNPTISPYTNNQYGTKAQSALPCPSLFLEKNSL